VATSSGIYENTTEATGRPSNRGVILAVACAAQFMVVLDVAIVNVALPSIQRDLGLGRDALQWVIIAYGLMLGGFMLLGGRSADLLGRRRVLLVGLFLFTLASLLAGVSESAGFLIGARALQGFGAALLPPAALSILAVTFTEGDERNRAIGFYGAVTGVSASVGVIVSGVLTDGPGWHWIFLVNVPIGAVLIAAAAAVLPREEGRRGGQFDAAGAVSVTGGLLLLVYALDRGADVGWSTASTLCPLAGAVVLLAAFAGIERRSRAPLVPGSAVRDRVLVAANLSALFTFGAFFAFIFLGSLLMQQVLGYSPTKTGLAWLATTATSFVAAAVTGGKLVALVGVRRLLVGGQLLLAVSVALLTRVSPDAGFATGLLPTLLLAGVAGGVAAPAAQIGALSGVTAAMTGLASGLVETMREIGGAVAVAAVAAVLVSRAGVDAYHAGFWMISGIAVLGAVAAAIGFPRGAREVVPVPASP
jgi:EmrB/QacA subfamily drug resistance transporter